MTLATQRFFTEAQLLISRVIDHQVPLVAAGCAFYGTLALFPALSMLVSLYGLVLNPTRAVSQLDLLRDLLPPEAWQLIAHQVDILVQQPSRTLGLGLAASVLATLWSAAAGTKSLLSALNLAEGEPETRSLLRFQVTGLAMTLAAMLAGVVTLALLVALPAAFAFIGISGQAIALVNAASFVVLLLFVSVLLATLYRFGPARRPVHVVPGALVGTLLWLFASWALASLGDSVLRLGTTYGPLATAAAMMLWLWVSSFATLFGAEVNAALRQR